MRANLINDLKNLAQEILLLKEDNEVGVLRQKALQIYDRLTVLEILNKETPSSESNFSPQKPETSIDNESNFDPSFDDKKEDEFKENINQELSFDTIKDDKLNEVPNLEIEDSSTEVEDLFVPTFDSIKEDMSQKEEFKDTISLEETEKLFETKKEDAKQLSLNDKLLSSSIQIGLNDRIAFVNQLFNFSQSEFNTVLSKLNTCENKDDALAYIQHTVKQKYNWKGKEELEERLIFIIERKFL